MLGKDPLFFHHRIYALADVAQVNGRPFDDHFIQTRLFREASVIVYHSSVMVL